MSITLDTLTAAIRQSWSAESAFRTERWSVDNPAAEHYAVTALVIQDYLGGEIIKCEVSVDGYKHFYNQLPNCSYENSYDQTCAR